MTSRDLDPVLAATAEPEVSDNGHRSRSPDADGEIVRLHAELARAQAEARMHAQRAADAARQLALAEAATAEQMALRVGLEEQYRRRLEAEVAAARAEVARMQATLSWRVTGWLRAVRTVQLRRRRG